MHELSYILDIIDSVKEVKERENATKIKKIEVDVGEMSGVVPYYLEKYYKESVKDTFLEDTELITHEKKVIFLCSTCQKEYHPDKMNHYCCPFCKSRAGILVQGKGVIISKIEIEDDNI